jgi:hypothetical protein
MINPLLKLAVHHEKWKSASADGKMSFSALDSLSEQEFYDALHFANKAASLVCSKQDTDPPFFDEVLSLQ